MTSQHQVTWYRVTSQSVWVCCRRQQWRHRFLCSKLGSVSIAWRSFMKSSVLGAIQSEPEKHKNNKGEIYLEMLICLLSTASCDKTYVICSKCVEEWIASNVRWRHVRRRWPWPVCRCKRCWGTCWEVWFVVGREIDHCKRQTHQWMTTSLRQNVDVEIKPITVGRKLRLASDWWRLLPSGLTSWRLSVDLSHLLVAATSRLRLVSVRWRHCTVVGVGAVRTWRTLRIRSSFFVAFH